MTAEGTACNGAGEARKAEFSPEKAAAASPEEAVAASPEEKAAGEREGEDVGGPFVIVNGGDSDGHSDRGSDLGKAQDEDSPSEEDDAPGSNAAPDAAAGGDHGAASGEVSAPGAAPGTSSVDGGDRVADGSEGGADDGTAEPSSYFVPEVPQQEAASEDHDEAAALASSGSDPAVISADSEGPAVDSEVQGKEDTVDESAATDIPELEVPKAASQEKDREDVDAESTGLADALTSDKSSSAVMESQVNGDVRIGSIEEQQSAADVVEPVEQSTGGASALMENGHLCADMRDDSFEAAIEAESQEDAAVASLGHDDAPVSAKSGSAAIEPEVNGEDSKEQSAADVVQIVEDGTDGACSLMANGHVCADTREDSFEASTEPRSHDSKLEQSESVEGNAACEDGIDATQPSIVASESEAHAIETEVQETDQLEEGAPATEAEVSEGTTEAQVSEGLLEAADRNCAGSVEEPTGEESEVHAIETEGKETDQQEEGAPTTEAEVSEGMLVTDQQEEGDPTAEAEVSEGLLEAADRNCALSVEKLIGKEVDADGHSNTESSAEAFGEPEAMAKQTEGKKLGMDGVDSSCHDCISGVISNEEVELSVEKAVNESVADICEPDVVNENTSQDTMQGDGSELKDQEEVAIVDETAAESDLKADNVDNVVEVETAACEVEVTEVKDEADLAPVLSQNCGSSIETVEHEKIEAPAIGQPNEIENDVAAVEPNEKVEREVIDDLPLQEGAASAASTFHSEPRSIDLVDSVSSPATELESMDHLHTEERRSLEISHITVGQLVCNASLEHESMVANEAEITSETVNGSQEKPSLNQSEICNASTASDECFNEVPSPINKVTCNGSCSDINVSTKASDEVETKCLEEHKGNDEHVPAKLHGDHVEVIGPQRIYMIKIPRFAGEDLWAKTQAAQAHLDQLTQERDAINRRKQKQKAVCDQYREKLDAARREEREARAAHGDKKNDLNSVRSVIGKMHQANSIEEIDELIATKERTMQHETISLKEEKKLIKEITDLKAQRKQLSSIIGSKAEINEAFDQKDHIHERHKALKKDSDVLFTSLKSLEENTKKILKSFEEEKIALRKLNEEYRVANESRQKAYSEWSELKAEPWKKNQHFFTYRDNRKTAENFKVSGDIHELQSYCSNQIKRAMELWNEDEDFRKQYIESNKFSTLRRLGTLDGRKLGPDEDPPVIPSRRPMNTSPLTASSPDVPTLTSVPAPALAAPASVPAKEDSFPVLPSPQISKRAKSKASGSSAQNENNAVSAAEAEDIKQTEKEKARLMEEQRELARKAEELARKEEELRKERAAAEKERLRLEQKAKAKEAEERKRRKAEKEKERAEFKARKEAEEKEKKKAKKDKKKGTTPGDSGANGVGTAAALGTEDTDSNSSDNPREVEAPQPKRLSRPAAAIKQLNRVQPMPAPLRNRGRRKMRQYILIAAAVLSVLALFMAGNYIPRLKSLHH